MTQKLLASNGRYVYQTRNRVGSIRAKVWPALVAQGQRRPV